MSVEEIERMKAKITELLSNNRLLYKKIKERDKQISLLTKEIENLKEKRG